MSLLSHCYNSGQVARDIDPVVAKRDAQGEVWEVVVERYLKHMREHRRPSTVYASKCILARVDWKGRRIGTIKWQEIAALLEGIKGNGLTGSPAPVMANRVFAVLRCLFNFAVSQELLERNPCERKSKPSKEVSRDRVLSDEELARIWAACTEYPFGPLVRMLMLTGQRRDEVASATWDEFNGEVWHLPAARTKNGRAHDVFLSLPGGRVSRVTAADKRAPVHSHNCGFNVTV